jgi:hypothetical protein
MTWLGGVFLDHEDAREVCEDPFRCAWCHKPFDAARMQNAAAPEALVMESVLRMRIEGRSLDDVMHYVELGWKHEGH